MRFILSCFLLLIIAGACGSKVKGRYISDGDTTFSDDIRSISARINKEPSNADLYYKRANTFYFETRFRDALQDIDFALFLDSLNPVYHARKAEILMGNDSADSKLAMAHYRKALKLKPGMEDALSGLGKILLARQAYPEALETFNALLDVNPMNAGTLVIMGLAAKEMKDTAQAIMRFEKALSINPSEFNAVMQMANLYAARKPELALQYYDRALTVDEYSDEALYAKGFLLQQLGRYKDALSLYQRTKEANAGHRFAYYNSAVIYGLFKDFEEALRWLDDLIAIDENFVKAYHYRAFVNEQLGRTKDAIGDYRKTLELDPKNEDARTRVSELSAR
jgi:tetratricopeptide (TPR) repeat protein